MENSGPLLIDATDGTPSSEGPGLGAVLGSLAKKNKRQREALKHHGCKTRWEQA